MTSCETIKCPDFKNGKCYNERDTVNKFTGEPMCHLNSDAISREEYESEVLK